MRSESENSERAVEEEIKALQENETWTLVGKSFEQKEDEISHIHASVPNY